MNATVTNVQLAKWVNDVFRLREASYVFKETARQYGHYTKDEMQVAEELGIPEPWRQLVALMAHSEVFGYGSFDSWCDAQITAFPAQEECGQ